MKREVITPAPVSRQRPVWRIIGAIAFGAALTLTGYLVDSLHYANFKHDEMHDEMHDRIDVLERQLRAEHERRLDEHRDLVRCVGRAPW